MVVVMMAVVVIVVVARFEFLWRSPFPAGINHRLEPGFPFFLPA